jgi:predicted acetyltransferase
VQYDVRVLTHEDRTAAWALGSLAFGFHDRQMPEVWGPDVPGRRDWGAFDNAGRLVAKAVDREQGHWFGGRVVPASGVAGVAVAPESRGSGLARLVLTRLLADARDRGAMISTLFDTTPFPYRSLGWEEVGALTWRSLPTMALAGIRAPERVTLRPTAEADVPALHAVYQTVARAGAGMMERSGPLFAASPADFLADYDGVTLAAGEDGAVEGYASWNRGLGYDAAARVTVADLIGLTPSATVALLSMLGSWASVAPTLLLRLPDPDPALLMTWAASARVESRQPWMLRVVDAVGAVAARGWPTYVRGRVDLDLADDVCAWNAGPHQLVLADGQGRLEPGGHGDVRLTARGFGMLYAGAAGPALLRRAGLLSGGDARTDEFLQAATAGPAPALLDYF